MAIPYTEHLRADGAAMADAAAVDLDAHVPTCPEWNVAKLIIHTGQHHRWVAEAVAGGGKTPAQPPKPGLRGDELIAWFREGWAELADLLDRSEDDTPAWSWSGDNRVGFWRRRTALETAVHRWDAENATGEGKTIDKELSADGIDEIVTVMFPDQPYTGSPGKVAWATTDTGDSWLFTLETGAPASGERGSSNRAADATAKASAEEMLLSLWGRIPKDVLVVEGDEELFRSFHAWVMD